jgi:hypothetical protein
MTHKTIVYIRLLTNKWKYYSENSCSQLYKFRYDVIYYRAFLLSKNSDRVILHPYPLPTQEDSEIYALNIMILACYDIACIILTKNDDLLLPFLSRFARN